MKKVSAARLASAQIQFGFYSTDLLAAGQAQVGCWSRRAASQRTWQHGCLKKGLPCPVRANLGARDRT
ncbi:hypothetical protein [Eleftheria terrae]|uniref:hypothetical protein n=1 Tax=Eleftheria terrae TaxID=1597781 RepID=UPI00263AFE24|nr:hypothetical protein [Eleftheria terrae]WKB52800.1 hypothetical protein N7L95_24005 [Eleftheria terrae]